MRIEGVHRRFEVVSSGCKKSGGGFFQSVRRLMLGQVNIFRSKSRTK